MYGWIYQRWEQLVLDWGLQDFRSSVTDAQNAELSVLTQNMYSNKYSSK